MSYVWVQSSCRSALVKPYWLMNASCGCVCHGEGNPSSSRWREGIKSTRHTQDNAAIHCFAYVPAAILEAWWSVCSGVLLALLLYHLIHKGGSRRWRLGTEVAFSLLIDGSFKRLFSCFPGLQIRFVKDVRCITYGLLFDTPSPTENWEWSKRNMWLHPCSQFLKLTVIGCWGTCEGRLTLWSFPGLFPCKTNTSVNGK